MAYINVPAWIFNDNNAAVELLRLRKNSSKSKHFDVQLRYVTQLVEQKRINVFWIPRGENFADIDVNAFFGGNRFGTSACFAVWT